MNSLIDPKVDPNPYRSKIELYSKQVLCNSIKSPTPKEIEGVSTITSKYKKIIVELGSGSGAHLLERARQAPETVFIGFELRFKRACRTVEKANQYGLQNVYILRTLAQFLPSFFPLSSLSGIYMNFPDPWDKKRWKKNRMMSASFLESAYELLVPQGFISFKTDHQGYFEDTKELFKGTYRFRLIRESQDFHKDQADFPIVISEFEKLFLAKGQPIFFLHGEKI